jgi:NDP-sugar pyrophosphorylase family protein
MLAFHQNQSAKITVGLREYQHTVPFGVAEVINNEVLGLREKPTMSWLANAGIYVVDPSVAGLVRKNEPCTMPELIARCIDDGLRVAGYRVQEEWIDVGRPADLSKARFGDIADPVSRI